MKDSEEIKNLRKSHGLTQQQLADKLGVTRELISNIERGVNSITKQMRILIQNFISSNDETMVLSEPTFEYGVAKMTKEDLLHIRNDNNLTQQELADLIKISIVMYGLMERGEKPISRKTELEIQELIRTGKLKNPNGSVNKLSLFKPIPFFDINVSAGNVTFLDGGLLKNTEPDDFMFIPKNIDADIAFPTFGHSMYPEISNGDRVAYKLLKDWTFFNYGMKYLIVTEEQRLLKYIRRHDKDGFLLLESRNNEYQPIDMPLTSIKYILQVRYIGKTEM